MHIKSIFVIGIITLLSLLLLLAATKTLLKHNFGDQNKNVQTLNNYSINENNENEAIKTYQAILDKIIISDSYGGAFIDDKGDLNINIVGEGTDVKNSINNRVKYHYVNYSLKQLEEIQMLLVNNMVELGLSMVSIDEKANMVNVYFSRYDELKASKVKEFYNSPAINFIKKDHKVTI